MENAMEFKHVRFSTKLKTMLGVDFKRMFLSKMVYILMGISLLMPILILVMTTMMGSSGESVAFTNAWQAIGSLPGSSSSATSMDMTSMCNINLIYMLMVVLVGCFISDDFKCGYAKNLFTVRSKKLDYALSKTIVISIGGILMLLCYFIGTIIGGNIAGLSFDTSSFGVSGLVMCMISKAFFMVVMVSIFELIAMFAKARTWLAICGGLAGGMLLFMMISSITPLNSTLMNVILTVAGAGCFGVGFSFLDALILDKTRLA